MQAVANILTDGLRSFQVADEPLQRPSGLILTTPLEMAFHLSE